MFRVELEAEDRQGVRPMQVTLDTGDGEPISMSLYLEREALPSHYRGTLLGNDGTASTLFFKVSEREGSAEVSIKREMEGGSQFNVLDDRGLRQLWLALSKQQIAISLNEETNLIPVTLVGVRQFATTDHENEKGQPIIFSMQSDGRVLFQDKPIEENRGTLIRALDLPTPSIFAPNDDDSPKESKKERKSTSAAGENNEFYVKEFRSMRQQLMDKHAERMEKSREKKKPVEIKEAHVKKIRERERVEVDLPLAEQVKAVEQLRKNENIGNKKRAKKAKTVIVTVNKRDIAALKKEMLSGSEDVSTQVTGISSSGKRHDMTKVYQKKIRSMLFSGPPMPTNRGSVAEAGEVKARTDEHENEIKADATLSQKLGELNEEQIQKQLTRMLRTQLMEQRLSGEKPDEMKGWQAVKDLVIAQRSEKGVKLTTLRLKLIDNELERLQGKQSPRPQ